MKYMSELLNVFLWHFRRTYKPKEDYLASLAFYIKPNLIKCQNAKKAIR